MHTMSNFHAQYVQLPYKYYVQHACTINIMSAHNIMNMHNMPIYIHNNIMSMCKLHYSGGVVPKRTTPTQLLAALERAHH